MNDLIILKNNKPMCDSLQVAEKFHKNHRDVTRDIDNLIAQNCAVKMMFSSSDYKAKNGQVYRMYYMNRDGFSLLAMGFTGKDALKWKLEYIKAFNVMEAIIMERQSPSWQQARVEGKKARRMETDAIKEFVSYAQEHGSKSADKYYIHYSKLADKAVGITDRDSASTDQLLNLRVVEMMIDKAVLTEITAGTEYHQAFKNVKAKIQQVAELAFKPRIAIAG